MTEPETEPPAVASPPHPESDSVSEFHARPSQHGGEVLGGRYKIRGYMTSGGTARVYIAEDLETQGPVVVKMLAPEVARRTELAERLLREAEALRSIDHPNVVRVLASGEDAAGVPYVVLEALRGQTLGEYLRSHGAPPLERALRIAEESARGLHAAHEVGIVHRDVKPDNLLLLEDHEALTVKVIDFGMAKLRHNKRTGTTQTILGTVEYMAPEQILVEEIDARTDIYGLGVVMFRLFTGHLPFETQGPADLVRHQLFSSMPPPSWLTEDLDDRLERIILTATRKHPENRYHSLLELLEDLTSVAKPHADASRACGKNLAVAPDAYAPRTRQGYEALNLLAERFGPYAQRSVAPPPSGDD